MATFSTSDATSAADREKPGAGNAAIPDLLS
jgi:hypothetical protein